MKYKKFNETRRESIVITRFVELSWNHRHMAHYVSLGYKYTARGEKFKCAVCDLLDFCKTKILVECPVCGETRNIAYADFVKIGHTLCRSCSHTSDLTGMRFGRLVALEVDRSRSEPGVYWLCMCDCGEQSSVRTDGLITGVVRSCGCYWLDMKKSSIGENNPNWKRRNKLLCENCGEEYTTLPYRESVSRFCSNECFYEYNSGERNPAWNPDLTDEDRIIGRNYPEYKEYIKAVMDRDNYTCVVCERYGDNIEVHHMFDYASYPQYRTVLEYGVTVCYQDHRDFHKWMGGTKVSCTPMDFDLWLTVEKEK